MRPPAIPEKETMWIPEIDCFVRAPELTDPELAQFSRSEQVEPCRLIGPRRRGLRRLKTAVARIASIAAGVAMLLVSGVALRSTALRD